MRIFVALVSLLLATSVLAADPAPAAAAPKDCVFTYKPDSVKVFWTGYKFFEKKGVKGEFKDFKVNSSTTAKSVDELLLSTSIDIDSSKFDSGDAGRDTNLRDKFFKMIKGPHILGKVKEYKSGILKVQTTMNGVSKVLAFRVNEDGKKFKGDAGFDMIDVFKMKKPFESISKTCAQQHRGPDGKSKTWTQVSVDLEGEIMNSCDVAAAAATPAGANGGH